MIFVVRDTARLAVILYPVSCPVFLKHTVSKYSSEPKGLQTQAHYYKAESIEKTVLNLN